VLAAAGVKVDAQPFSLSRGFLREKAFLCTYGFGWAAAAITRPDSTILYGAFVCWRPVGAAGHLFFSLYYFGGFIFAALAFRSALMDAITAFKAFIRRRRRVCRCHLVAGHGSSGLPSAVTLY
jgi:hypothetical protein